MYVSTSMLDRIRKVTGIGVKGVSARIRCLLQLGLGYHERYILKMGSRNRQYREVGEGKRINVLLDEELYLLVKKLHLDCNYYSMAQIVREVLNHLLCLTETQGFLGMVEEIEALTSLVKKEDSVSIGGKSMYIHTFSRVITTYTDKYTPVSTQYKNTT